MRRFILIVALACSFAAVAEARLWIVDQAHTRATDTGEGTAEAPFKTIAPAAERAMPGDTVRVHAGIYRERVAPARGGDADQPITYEAAPGQRVIIKGSELWTPAWERSEHPSIYQARLTTELFQAGLPAIPPSLTLVPRLSALSPYRTPYQRRPDLTLGQIFVDGMMLDEVPRDRLALTPGSWATDGESVSIHFPARTSPTHSAVEITTRSRIFAPYLRGLGYITVRGFIMEHCANQFHSGFYNHDSLFPQMGALSARGGHHWVIENNVVRYAKSTGIDCGNEGPHDADGLMQRRTRTGSHLIQGNEVSDNGAAGIIGHATSRARIIGNVVARNNRLGVDGAESAGIKLHYFLDGVVEGNLILDNYASGLWVDNGWANSRITRNVVVGNTGAGVFIELGQGPLLVDNNVIALTRSGINLAGDGIYSHDCAGVTVAHNLLYGNSNFGLFLHIGTERRGKRPAASDWLVVNNIVLGNTRGAISLPADHPRSQNNVSDSNLLSSGYDLLTSETYGSPLDQPLFLVNTNKGRVELDELVRRFDEALTQGGIPTASRPNLAHWRQNPVLTLAQWRLLTGQDENSLVPLVLRPQLTAGSLHFSFVIDPSIKRLQTRPLKGLDIDLLGQPLPTTNALPGPFQQVRPEPLLDQSVAYATPFRGAYERLRDPITNSFRLWPIPPRPPAD